VDGDGVERWQEDVGRKIKSIRNYKAGMGGGKLILSKFL
jgi:hypothetical protein